MRKSALALALAFMAVTGLAVPTAQAAVGPKIVVIVGAVHGATDSYRSRGQAAYVEALKYSTNVVKLFSPNATWSKVKAAMQGASIVIYMGHGNGFPSPYRTSPWPYSQNGFGLNAKAGEGDYNTKYYGEYYIGNEVELAPNAIVLLHHLCYASGNSETGKPDPSPSVARQRVDNFAAGFLKAGAAAVIADGHMGAGPYLQALFTTSQTIEQLWRNAPNANGNTFSFDSSRSPGNTVFMDPDRPNDGYYRSLVGKPDTTTGEIVNGGVDTGAGPAALVVPGNAQVSTEDAPLYDGSSLQGDPSGVVPAGTRLRVVAWPLQTTAQGDPLVEVEGLDDPSIHGFMVASDLAPKDSAAPVVLRVDTGLGAFSPNADAVADTITIEARISDSVDWLVRFTTTDGSVLAERTGTGRDVAAMWDGLISGTPVGGGSYRFEITAVDAWGNDPATFNGSFLADLTPPVLSAVVPASDPVAVFTPNGDGASDSIDLTGQMSEAGSIAVRVRNGSDTTVRTFTMGVGSGDAGVARNGKDETGAVVPDGIYTLRLTPIDRVGNTGTAVSRTVQVVTTLGFVRSSKSRIYPQDLDRLAKSTTLSFKLPRPATVTWELLDGSDTVVETWHSDTPLAAGTYSRSFNGRTTGGAMLPRGMYRSRVTATEGASIVVQTAAFDMNAFTVTASDTTPGRGQKVTIRAISAEALSTTPKLKTYQPGLAKYTVRMSKTGKRTYAATVTLKSGGSTGTIAFKVVARDKYGKKHITTIWLPLH